MEQDIQYTRLLAINATLPRYTERTIEYEYFIPDIEDIDFKPVSDVDLVTTLWQGAILTRAIVVSNLVRNKSAQLWMDDLKGIMQVNMRDSGIVIYEATENPSFANYRWGRLFKIGLEGKYAQARLLIPAIPGVLVDAEQGKFNQYTAEDQRLPILLEQEQAQDRFPVEALATIAEAYAASVIPATNYRLAKSLGSVISTENIIHVDELTRNAIHGQTNAIFKGWDLPWNVELKKVI